VGPEGDSRQVDAFLRAEVRHLAGKVEGRASHSVPVGPAKLTAPESDTLTSSTVHRRSSPAHYPLLLGDRRVRDQRAAMAVVAEMEVVDRVGAAEMQLCGMPRTILYREDAAAERYFRCRCRVDVVEIDGVIEIGLGEAADDAFEVH